MTQAAKTAELTRSVPEDEVPEWCAVEWTYVGPDDKRFGYGVIKWEHGEPVVAPFSEAMRVAEAVGLLEGQP